MCAAPLILALGDSLIAGYGLRSSDSLPAQLEGRLKATRPGVRVINAGVSGATSTDVLRRLPTILSNLDDRPDLALLQVGPNDVLRRVPPEITRASLSAILIELTRCGIPVLLTTVEPPVVLRDQAQAYLGLHQELADVHGAATHALFPAGIMGHPLMVLPDRVHPNAAAIAKVVDALLPRIEPMLPTRR